MPEYEVLAHRRVIKFLKSLRDERLRDIYMDPLKTLNSLSPIDVD